MIEVSQKAINELKKILESNGIHNCKEKDLQVIANCLLKITSIDLKIKARN